MRLVVLTRFFLPDENGLAHHSLFLASLCERHFDEVVVFCRKHPKRDISQSCKFRIFEYRTILHLFGLLKIFFSNSRDVDNVVLFQYVPHMWGRSGVAPAPALLPLWIRLRFHVPVITFLHELAFDWSMIPRNLMLGIQHRLQLLAIGLASHHVIVTNHIRYRRLVRHYGLKCKLTRMSVGAISANTNGGSYTDLGLPEQYITWFGTLSRDQHLEELVHGFEEASKECPGLHLLLMGAYDRNSDRFKRILEFIRERGVECKVLELGFVEDEKLTTVLSNSVAHFHMVGSGPSGRRSVVAAYLRSGRPVIAVNGHETDPEFINGKNVLFIRPTPASVSKAIMDIWSNQKLVSELVSGGRELYQRLFSSNVILQKFMDSVYCATQSKGRQGLSRNQVRGGNHMRVGVLVPTNEEGHVRGGHVQIKLTVEQLRLRGVDVFTASSVSELPQVDICHVVGIQDADFALSQVRQARYKGLPVVISSIWWDFAKHGLEAGWESTIERKQPRWSQFHRVTPRLAKATFFKTYQMRNLIANRKRRTACRSADVILPNSPLEAHLVNRLAGIELSHVVVRNGVSEDVFYVTDDKPRDIPFLFVGIVDRTKNVHRLIQAVNELRAPLTVVGQCPDDSYLNYCKSLDKNHVVTWLGRLTHQDLVSYYNRSRVVALPSLRETPGLTLLEGAACGANVVATNVGSTYEYFSDMADYCEPLSVQSIVVALTAASARSTPNLELSNYVRTHYTWGKAAEDTIKAYQHVLNAASSAVTSTYFYSPRIGAFNDISTSP